jgi:hypothetical protein
MQARNKPARILELVLLTTKLVLYKIVFIAIVLLRHFVGSGLFKLQLEVTSYVVHFGFA